ncbi:alpha-amylase family glycosyl hydrolase [Caproiciproducens sp. LBM24188]
MKKVFKNKVVSIGLSFLLTFSLLLSNSASAQAVAGTGTNADTNISQYVQSSSALNENDIIYMVLTDRFYDGDSSNNGTLNVEYRPGNLKYTQGGDWKGLTQKLDYIKNLGVTAIWISPVSENEPLSRDKSESGYHGYFTHDYNKADPHFGSKQDLINLVSTAHSKGLTLVLI